MASKLGRNLKNSKGGPLLVFFAVFHESTQITSMSDVLKEQLMGILGIGYFQDSTHFLGCCDPKNILKQK